MADLTGKTPADTFKSLVQFPTDADGVTAALQTIEDGKGVTTTLQLSTTLVNILGNLTLAGTVDGRDIATDGTNLDGIVDAKEVLFNDQSTGLLKGGIVSINVGDNTKFDFTALTLHVVDSFTDPKNPIITKVEIAAQTAVTGTEVVTNSVTFIGIRLDNVAPTGGTSTAVSATIDGVPGTVHITQKPDIAYTNAETRDIVQIGIILHSQSIIEDNFNIQQIVPNVALHLHDLAAAIGVFNISGNTFSANGANLNIDKSEGKIFRIGGNNDGTIAGLKNPNVVFSSLASPATFIYSHRNGSGGFTLITNQTLIDPDNFDNGSGTLVAVGNNKFTIKKLYIGSDDFIGIEYGQVEFIKLSLAEEAVTEPTVVNPAATSNTSFRGWLIVKEGITDLTAAIIAGDAKFIEANRFSSSASGSSITGEINTVLNVGIGGVGVFKQKTGVILEFKNVNAGSSKISVTDDTGNDEIDIDIVPANILTSTLNNDAGFISGATGALTLLATATASASSSIDFTSGIDSTFDMYLFTFNGVDMLNGNSKFTMRVGNGGIFDAGASDYSFSQAALPHSVLPAFVLDGDNAETSIELAQLIGSGTTEGVKGGHVFMSNAAIAASHTTFEGQLVIENAGGTTQTVTFGGARLEAAVHDRVQFIPSSGTFQVGEFKMYGVQKS